MATKTTKGGSYEYTDKVKNSPSRLHNAGTPGNDIFTQTTKKNLKEKKGGEIKYHRDAVSTSPSDAGNLAGNMAGIRAGQKLNSYTKNPLKKK